MPDYAIRVTRADGRLQPVALTDPALDRVCAQALLFAQNAALHGCPLGDALPPKWVDIMDGDQLVLRITVDDSLRPVDHKA